MISVFSMAELIRATAAACASVCVCVCVCECVCVSAHVSVCGLMVSGLRLQFPSHPDMSEAVNQNTHAHKRTQTHTRMHRHTICAQGFIIYSLRCVCECVCVCFGSL